MAEEQVGPMAAEERGGGSVLGAVAGAIGMAFLAAASVMSTVWDALTEDGTLAAAGRQGIDELGMALKAFPDSIQVQESGSIWNPTQGEIAADRRDSGLGGDVGVFGSSYYQSYSNSAGPRESWPSEIAQDVRPYDPGQDHGQDTGTSL